MTQHILFVAKECDDRLCSAAKMLAEHAVKQGCSVSVADEASSRKIDVPLFDETTRPDVIVTLGGDGTFLRAVRTYLHLQSPFLGIKLGKLGFLTGATLDEATRALDKALDKTASIEKRNILEVSLLKDGEEYAHEYALNEMVAGRSPHASLITTRLNIDGHNIYTTSGDGLIVSTATGSTAYALSAGGPIMSPQFEGLVIIPLASHTLIQRALVTSHDELVVLDFPDPDRAEVELCFDGQTMIRLDQPTRVECRVSDLTVEVIKLDSRLFYDTVSAEFFRGQCEGR